jgi:CBS domain-containing protein
MVPRGEVPTLEPAQNAVDALAILSDGDTHRGLVLDRDRLAGLLSITDLTRALEVRSRNADRVPRAA